MRPLGAGLGQVCLVGVGCVVLRGARRDGAHSRGWFAVAAEEDKTVELSLLLSPFGCQ